MSYLSEPMITWPECETLADGMGIWVLWDGGNGPYLYEVQRSDGRLWAMLPGTPVKVAPLSDGVRFWRHIPVGT